MESTEQVHSHYWPGEGCIPISPQARRLGWEFEVYVTRSVWSRCITWTPDKKSNPDKRIFELLEAAWQGMGKALAAEPDCVFFKFKHWFWQHGRPKATKQVGFQFGTRLLLDPETEEPWILIFDPEYDNEEVLKRGEHAEDRGAETPAGELGLADDAEVDDGSPTAVRPPDDDPHIGAVEGS